jgi:putative transposase
LLAVSRSSTYRRPAEVSETDRVTMGLIDRQYLARPYYGSRRMAAWLATQGHVVNRKRVQRLMRLMGLVAIYQRPNTSKAAAAHKVYPYLLGGIAIERVNQVWCSDITYIPMAKGFLYLVVIMDWVSRAVLAWRLSNTLGTEFCVDALEEALSEHGRPEIFNTDQGSQFTSDGFTGTLEAHDVTISMDGKGRCMDNIFVERLWRSLKYEEVYLHAYATVAEAKAGIGAWISFYNDERQHQSLGYRTPRRVYEEGQISIVRCIGRPTRAMRWQTNTIGPSGILQRHQRGAANEIIIADAQLDTPVRLHRFRRILTYWRIAITLG